MVTSITLRFPALARLCGGFSTLSRNSFHAICMQRARLLFLTLRFFIASRKTPDTSKCPLWLVAAFPVSGPGNLPTLDTRILHRMPVSSFTVSGVLREGDCHHERRMRCVGEESLYLLRLAGSALGAWLDAGGGTNCGSSVLNSLFVRLPG